MSSCSGTVYWKDYLCSIVLPLFLCQRSLDYVYVGLLLDSTLYNGKFVYSLPVPLLAKITKTLQWFLKADSVSPPTLFFSINIVLAILYFLSPHVSIRGFPSVTEKAMAPHSSNLAGKSHGWRSLVGCRPWGRKESDMTEQLHFHFSLSTFMRWRKKWQLTPIFLPGESQGQRSLVGCCLWGHTESDTTEATLPPPPQLPMM